jgi:chaperonin GroES
VKLKPLSDNVLVRPVEDDKKTSGGIFIPDTAKEKPLFGKVIAVGPGNINDNGKCIPMNIKIGNIVIFEKYSGTEVKLGGQDHLIIKESEILAVVK